MTTETGSDTSTDLPEGWAACRMGDIATVVGGGTPAANDPTNFSEHAYPWITPADLSDFEGVYIARGRRDLSNKGLASSSARMVPAGAVLMSSRAPIGYLAIAGNPLSTNQGFKSFALPGEVESKYVFYWLTFLRPSIEAMGSGSTFAEVSGGKCKEIPLSLPPQAEQKRIVAKVEEVLARVNAARERLAKLPRILKRFRQSVLAAACSGRLTADLHSEGADDLPAGWSNVTVGDVIDDLKYGTSAKCDYPKRGVPVLRIPNIGDGVIKQDDLKYAPLDRREFDQLRLTAGDLLMIRSNGSVSLLGKVAMVREADADFAYAGYLIRLRPNRSKVLPEFLNAVLGSYAVRLQIELPARSTSGVNNINSSEVRALPVPLPPLAEQQEIMIRVTRLSAVADKIEARLAAGLMRSNKLIQSTLAKAFRGELVPTEAELAEREGRDFESADQLLARIRASREASSTTVPRLRRAKAGQKA